LWLRRESVKFKAEDGSKTRLLRLDVDIVFGVAVVRTVELALVVDGVLSRMVDLENNAL